MAGFDPSTSILAGMDDAALQAYLTALQTAYVELSTGAKVSTVSYSQAGGAKSVTFTQTDLTKVTMAIRQVQAQLGLIPSRRRALGVKY